MDYTAAHFWLRLIDTGLSELILPVTKSEQFNKALEIQQSETRAQLSHVSNILLQICLLPMTYLAKLVPSRK